TLSLCFPALLLSPRLWLSLSPGRIRVPLPPTDVRVCELSDTYVVLCWNEPEPRGRELLTFNVERVSERLGHGTHRPPLPHTHTHTHTQTHTHTHPHTISQTHTHQNSRH